MALKFNFTVDQLIQYENLSEEIIDNLRRWCATQPIPQPTPEMIALFLLSCSGDELRAQATITSYYNIKNSAVEIFNNRNVNFPEIQDVMRIGYFCLMPRRTPDGCVVVYIKTRGNTSDNQPWKIRNLLKMICMVLEAAIFEYPPRNFIIIFDVQHMSLKLISKIKPKVVRIFLEYLQNGFPSKLKAIHVVNMVDILKKTLKVLKPFIKKEVWEMTKFHSKDCDMKKFYKECVDRDYLPEEFGGNLGSVELVNDITIQKLGALEDFFLNEELHRRPPVVDEI